MQCKTFKIEIKTSEGDNDVFIIDFNKPEHIHFNTESAESA